MSVDSSVELEDLGSLVDLAVQRILVSDEVAATKFCTGTPVDDPLRERQVLGEAGRRAVQMGLDRELTTRFFRSQIDASKVVQRGMLARWRARPDLAPTTSPDLQAIRARLDELTGLMLDQLRTTQALHRHTSLCRTLLLEARVPVVALHDLDGLHRRALDLAVEGVCSPA